VGDGGLHPQRVGIFADGTAGTCHFESAASPALTHALVFALIVLGIVIGVRFAWVMLYGAAVRQFRAFFEKRVLAWKSTQRAGGGIGLVVRHARAGHLGDLAGVPHEFHGRDVIVLRRVHRRARHADFAGFTMRPLITLLRIAPDASLDEDVSRARQAMMDAALEALAGVPGERAAAIRADMGRRELPASTDPGQRLRTMSCEPKRLRPNAAR